MHALASAFLATAIALPNLAFGQTGRVAASTDSMVVTTDWLVSHLMDPSVAVIEVTHEAGQRGPHIPGSRALFYRSMTVSRDGLSTELPSPDSLRALLEGLGVSSSQRVVVYASEAPMATRLLMTLDYLGHQRFAYLDGGLPTWTAEKRAVTDAEPTVTRGTFTIAPRTAIIATADWLSSRLGKPGTALIDTRTDGEYNGTGNRSGMPSAGHLDGARQLEWEALFDSTNGLLLKPRDELRQQFAERTRAGDTVVTYCWVGYRASATYFAARMLGYDVKFYDGSYQDWQSRKLPTKAGATP
ncbi:MAG: sulfurtransferase [Gemmatimonadaceae bacterium]|nr:sulfurtransferase [Gemmatimonadaceae bacterium]